VYNYKLCCKSSRRQAGRHTAVRKSVAKWETRKYIAEDSIVNEIHYECTWKWNHKTEIMQKFVIKKITRSTNITISEEQNLLQCSNQVQQLKQKQQLHLDDQNLENQISSVKMCGYLKKKRNVRKFIIKV